MTLPFVTTCAMAGGAHLTSGDRGMPIESDGHSKDNPRLYELIENAPKEGTSPTVWAWPQLVDYLKVAGQPVAGPWPPHQEPRPDPDYESGPQAVPDPQSYPAAGRGDSPRGPHDSEG